MPGTRPTRFRDESGTILNFANLRYHNGADFASAIDETTLYRVILQGNSGGGSPSGRTEFQLGTVVGSGDDRQGILGGTLSTAGPRFTIDGETEIADFDAVNLYGVQIAGAGVCCFAGAVETDIISCDEVMPNDAEWLNNSVIAPRDLGVEMRLGHNIKNTSFIAGSDATLERHVHHPVQGSPSDQTYTYTGMAFFGFGAVGSPDPKWHGLWDDSGVLQINVGAPSNPNAAEFDILAPGGSVSVTNTVTLAVSVVDQAGGAVEDARVSIHDTAGTTETPDDVELMNALTNASGAATESFNYAGDTAVYIRVRKSSSGTTRYVSASATGSILSTGLNVTVTLRVDNLIREYFINNYRYKCIFEAVIYINNEPPHMVWYTSVGEGMGS